MRFSINNLSPLVKFLIGNVFIIIAFIIDAIGGYDFIQGIFEGAGLVLVLLAAFGFYRIYKEKKSNKS